MVNKSFDIIVVGGGHSGTEAALASARMGCNTLLLTQNIDTLGQMSCNPAIGGIGKGHLVREIDALGGIMARAADLAGIQFRTLNASKGAAVRATRAQIDRNLYKKHIRKFIENQENLTVFQQSVDDILIENNKAYGVITQMGVTFYAACVVLTVGTFLGGKIHIGKNNYSGGRAGCKSASALAEKLRSYDLNVARLKTGTPPRIDGRTINYQVLAEQKGDFPVPKFSYLSLDNDHPEQISCYITYTSEKTHEIIRNGLTDSPLFSGQIEGIGPRYCPSIEDKVVRFAEKDRHQIFVEPEGLDVNEIYPNGISTSLSFATQCEFVNSIKGFEKAVITRPGYAIEYDFFDPRDLHYSLETKSINGLFFAGQINGTTGYEEAAAQGLIAGINAALLVKGAPFWCPGRHEAYIGVLIDDLVTRGTKEPYRMFTSRAEYRLALREDNADIRLTAIGKKLGCIDDNRWQKFNHKYELIEKTKQKLQSTWIQANSGSANFLNTYIEKPLTHEYCAWELLKRPELDYEKLSMAVENIEDISCEIANQVNIQAKYDGYLARQNEEIARLKRQEELLIPKTFDYKNVKGLSNEVCEKLSTFKPDTLGQASRIPGITPAAVSMLLVYLKKAS